MMKTQRNIAKLTIVIAIDTVDMHGRLSGVEMFFAAPLQPTCGRNRAKKIYSTLDNLELQVSILIVNF